MTAATGAIAQQYLLFTIIVFVLFNCHICYSYRHIAIPEFYNRNNTGASDREGCWRRLAPSPVAAFRSSHRFDRSA